MLPLSPTLIAFMTSVSDSIGDSPTRSAAVVGVAGVAKSDVAGRDTVVGGGAAAAVADVAGTAGVDGAERGGGAADAGEIGGALAPMCFDSMYPTRRPSWGSWNST